MDLIRVIIFCWFCWFTVIKGCTKENQTSVITEHTTEPEQKNPSTLFYDELLKEYEHEKEDRRNAEED